MGESREDRVTAGHALVGEEPIWFDDVDQPHWPRLAGTVDVDVVVVGAGITGLLTAWQLREVGMSVAVVEARRLAKGVTGHTTAKVSVAQGGILQKIRDQDVANRYAVANVEGAQLLRELAAAHAPDSLQVLPTILVAEEAKQEQDLQRELACLEAAGVAVEEGVDAGLSAHASAAARVPGQAQVQPYRLLTALANSLAADGCRIYERSPVLKLEAGRKQRVVETDIARVRADSVVLACHMPFPMRGLVFAKAFPYMGYAVALEVPADRALDAMHVTVSSSGHAIRFHEVGGRTFAIVSGEGHKVGSEEQTRTRYLKLVEWGREALGVPDARVERCWCTHDLRSADHVPYVGRLSRAARGVYMGTGYGGWGMTNAAAASIHLREVLQGNDAPWDDVFDSLRARTARRGVRLASENAKVAGHLAQDPFEGDGDVRPSELARGEGRLLRLDGRRVAAARDLDGTLHVLSPRCTHMGCLVKFNTAERTWDCPCHGSRFDIDGEVLYGPATTPLRQHATSEGTEPAEVGRIRARAVPRTAGAD